MTPLHVACANGLSSIAGHLLKAQATPNVCDRKGKSPGQTNLLLVSPTTVADVILVRLLRCRSEFGSMSAPLDRKTCRPRHRG